jgi:cardiolipin synthase A/B
MPLALLAILVLLAGCSAGARMDDGTRQPGPNGHPLIAEVYPNGYAQDGSDQFIRLYNPTDQAADLAGWSLGDGKIRAIFPPGASIGPRQSIYVARTGAGFRSLMGAPPDFTWGGARDGDAPVLGGGAGFAPARTGGVVLLRDTSSQPADALVYGDAAAVAGWRGAPVPAPKAGEAMDRARDEATWDELGPGEYVKDTDTAADWKQGHSWMDQRVYRPGQTWFAYPTYTVDNVTVYATPDSSYATVSALLEKARRSIDLNIYDIGLVPVADKLAAAAQRGVKVRLIIDAQSGTKLNTQESYIAKVVAEAGGQVRWIINDGSAGIHGRYVYDHAKYAVVDGRYVLVQSENLVSTGTPVDPSYGNRGWGTVVDHQGLAAYYARVFEADWNPAYGDLKSYQPGTPFGPPPESFVPDTTVKTGRYPHPFPAVSVRGPVAVTPVLAPDHALLETKGIIGLMRSARESLYIEQQYVQVYCHVFQKDPLCQVGQGV